MVVQLSVNLGIILFMSNKSFRPALSSIMLNCAVWRISPQPHHKTSVVCPSPNSGLRILQYGTF